MLGCKKYLAPQLCLSFVLVVSGSWDQLQAQEREAFPTQSLVLEQSWRLDGARGRFDGSGIERADDGELLVVRDSELAVYAVRFQANRPSAALVRHARYAAPLEKLDLGVKRFDMEGLAIDEKGILYACDEYARRVLRFTTKGVINSLPLDLAGASEFFSKTDRNASFEGIAIGGDRLYLANERGQGRILELDLRSGKLLNSFNLRTGLTAWPDTHYSGLDWDKGRLFALLREERAVIEVDPEARRIKRILRYHDVEYHPEHRYQTRVPFAGVMEGLLVEDDVVWLLSDNNGLGRFADKSDSRPTLFRCRIQAAE